jgi:dsDNA-specific endonuclease/ATPase MutS2
MIQWIRDILARALGLGGDGAASARESARAPETKRSRVEEDEPDTPAAEDDAPFVMPIEDAIDLHTFAPRDIPSVVEEYLFEAQARGLQEVRVIHGRGKGVQRRIVQGVLVRHPMVDWYRDAPATRGGWGATLVWLKRLDKKSGPGR